MNFKNKSLAEIHFAVFLFGLSGLFGKLLSLPPMIIVLGRVIFSSIFLLCALILFKNEVRLKEKKHYINLIVMGVILAVHWSTFFLSIQVSTIAIGLFTFSTFPVFVTFLEPYFFKETVKTSDIILAIITFSGVFLVIPNFQFGNNFTQGAIWGLVSGFTYAILSMLNRRSVKHYTSSIIAFYEQVVAAIVLTPFLFLNKPVFSSKDILLLILLGTVFTGISHSLFINGLKNIKTRTAGIISSLEPVYGILFACILLGEILTVREILGGSIVLGTALYSTIKGAISK